MTRIIKMLLHSKRMEAEQTKRLEKLKTKTHEATQYASASIDRLDRRLAELEEELRKASES